MWAQIDPRHLGVSGLALRAGYLFSAAAAALYLIGPEPAATAAGLPPARLSAWLWTPAILVPIALAVACFVLVGGGGHRNLRRSHIAAVSICVVLTQAAQFAVASPVGPDGWYFTELSWRFGQHGPAAVIDGYLVRPVALLPLVPVGLVSERASLILASGLSIVLSVLLFHLLLRPLHAHSAAPGWLPLWGAGLGGIAIAWWNPAQYSAQLYALIGYAWLLHWRIGRSERIDGLAWGVLALSAMSHLITPMLITVILLIEGRSNSTQAATARRWSILLIGFWTLWNGLPAWSSTRAVLGVSSIPGARWMLLFAGLTFVAILVIDHLRPGRAAADPVTRPRPRPPGVDVASLLIGLAIFSPVLVLKDISLGAPILSGRLVLYAAVPLGWWMLGLPARTRVEPWVLGLSVRRRVAMVGVVALIVGSVMALGHLSLVNRTLVSPTDATACWDLVEESGAWALFETEEPHLILYGHPHVPPTKELRFQFVRLGDGGLPFEITENGLSPYGAILVTSDVPARLDRYTPDGFTDNWTVVAAHEGLCRMKVRPDLIGALDPEVGAR